MDSNKLSRMGRRRFIKTLTSIGISSAAITHLSQDGLAKITDDPSDEIPRLLGLRHTNHDALVEDGEIPEREPEFYTIPRDEWVRTETVHNAAQELANQLPQNPYISTVVRSDGEGLFISVEYQIVERVNADENSPRDHNESTGDEIGLSYEDLQEQVPDRVSGSVGSGQHRETREGIRVETQRIRIRESATFNSKYRPVPGGCQVGWTFEDWYGTLATPASYEYSNDPCWVTAAHVIKREERDVYQQDDLRSSPKIGESDQWTARGNGDIATVLSNGTNLSWNIAGYNDSYDYQITGVLGRDKLCDMEQNDESLYIQGRTTGRNQGEVIGVDTRAPERIYLDFDTQGGDSGGPIFHVNSSGALIAGVFNNAIDRDRDGDFDESMGDIMAWAEEELNVIV